MDGKLTQDGANDVGIEDVGLRPFLGQAFNRLRQLLVLRWGQEVVWGTYLGS